MKKTAIILLLFCTILINIWIVFGWDSNDFMNSSNKEQYVFNNRSSIFCTNNRNIMDAINTEQKNKLDQYLLDLCVADSCIIKQKLNSSNEKEVIEAFELMKSRCFNDEYKEIMSIFDNYLNMNIINNEITNKK